MRYKYFKKLDNENFEYVGMFVTEITTSLFEVNNVVNNRALKISIKKLISSMRYIFTDFYARRLSVTALICVIYFLFRPFFKFY